MSDMKNRSCKHCGKAFHACGSCGGLEPYEWVYCSWPCWAEHRDATITGLRLKHNIAPEVMQDIMDTLANIERE